MGKLKKVELFNKVYSQYYAELVSYAFQKTSNYDDAIEICQEVFFTFFDKMDSIENNRYWLWGTLKNYISNYYRKQKNNNKIDDIDNYEDHELLSFINAFKDTRIVLKDAIENKTNFDDDLEKVVFNLKVINQYAFSEIAQTIGISKSKAYRVYLKVEKKILQYLKERGINDIGDLL